MEERHQHKRDWNNI